MANIFVTKYDRLLNAIIENMITGICDCVLCMCVDGWLVEFVFVMDNYLLY